MLWCHGEANEPDGQDVTLGGAEPGDERSEPWPAHGHASAARFMRLEEHPLVNH